MLTCARRIVMTRWLRLDWESGGTWTRTTDLGLMNPSL